MLFESIQRSLVKGRIPRIILKCVPSPCSAFPKVQLSDELPLSTLLVVVYSGAGFLVLAGLLPCAACASAFPPEEHSLFFHSCCTVVHSVHGGTTLQLLQVPIKVCLIAILRGRKWTLIMIFI